jgi:hypothetical protein
MKDDEFQQAIDESIELEKLDGAAVEEGRVYLTKEMARKVNSYWRVMNNRSVSGGELLIGGKSYARGLGVHAESTLTFDLKGAYSSFHVIPGPDDAHRGVVEFVIRVDDKELYRSGKMSSAFSKKIQPVEVSVKGAAVLTLMVETADGEMGGDHANWAGAYLKP